MYIIFGLLQNSYFFKFVLLQLTLFFNVDKPWIPWTLNTWVSKRQLAS